MFGFISRNWANVIRSATVAAAVLVILLSALGLSQDRDHDAVLAEVSISTDAYLNLSDDLRAAPVADMDCHLGAGCMYVVQPDTGPVLPRLTSTSLMFDPGGCRPSLAGCLPFHPPRPLSLV